MSNLKQKRQKVLNKIDRKVLDVLQKEKGANPARNCQQTGEAPRKIAKSIWKLLSITRNS